MQTEALNNNAVEATNASTAPSEAPRGGLYFRPSVDVLELKDELRIIVDMPGVNADGVDINFDDGELTIHGRVPARQGESERYLAQEYGIGDYYRAFQIGEAVDASKITAESADGVLTIHLPKVEAVKPRKILVEAK